MSAEGRANCPYEIVQIGGATAFEDWKRLKKEGRGTPVVVGDDGMLGRLVEQFHPELFKKSDLEASVAEILRRAASLVHPESLLNRKDAERTAFEEKLRSDPEFRSRYGDLLEQLEGANVSMDGAPIGDWPTEAPLSTGLSVAHSWQTGKPYDVVYVMLIPTTDWTTVPAYLQWGGWNGLSSTRVPCGRLPILARPLWC